MAIHSTAVVDSRARICNDVSIGAYSVIGPGVRLESGVRVAAHVVIDGQTTVGADTEIHPFAMVGAQPGHLKDPGEGTELVIGARVSVREGVSLHRGTKAGGGRTIIGDECVFLAHSHVGHDSVLGRGVVVTNGAYLGGHAHVEDFAILGGGSVVHQHCRLGTLIMVEGNCAIPVDIPPYCLAAGHRARLLGLNEVGLRRRGFAAEVVKALREVYRIVLRSDLLRHEALALVRSDYGAVAECKRFVEFISSTKRGIARHGRE